MCKKHYKNRYFSTFLKSKKWKKRAIFKVNNWAKLKSIIGPSWVRLKKRQLGPIIDFENLRALFFSFQKNVAETPIFIGFFDITCFFKTNLAQLLTLQTPKLGPIIDFTAYIYIYFDMYMYVYVCICMYMYVFVCICIYIYMYMYMYVC